MITLKAICLTAAFADCGILTEVEADNLKLGIGLVTHKAVADQLSSYTGYKPYLISIDDFNKIFTSDNFNFDVEFILPEEPTNPIPGCNVKKYEFITKWQI